MAYQLTEAQTAYVLSCMMDLADVDVKKRIQKITKELEDIDWGRVSKCDNYATLGWEKYRKK